jgi:hypothetical protein
MIEPLTPESMAGIYGRPGSLAARLAPKLAVKTKIVVIMLVLLAFVVVWCAIDGALLPPPDTPSIFGLYTATQDFQRVSLPLLNDPVGLLFVVAAVAAPFFCLKQVDAIRVFNPMNERNMAYRLHSLDLDTINEYVARANRLFRLVGTRWVSAGFFVGATGCVCLLYSQVHKTGLLPDWNPSNLSTAEWRIRVRDGWWANWDEHTVCALALIGLGIYMLYFAFKQLAMGAIFAHFVSRSLKVKYGVAPDLSMNRDGYYGLRPLRYFMQWTYVVAVTDFVTVLGLVAVWLPFDQLSVFLTLTVMTTNVFFVLYPTVKAAGGTIVEKNAYVAHIQSLPGLTTDQKMTEVERIWAVPHLPFRLRSTLSALTVYLLLPVLLGLVSTIIQND